MSGCLCLLVANGLSLMNEMEAEFSFGGEFYSKLNDGFKKASLFCEPHTQSIHYVTDDS